MKTLEELINENKHYHINRHCFGEYYGEEEIESYTCDQCGDWNGSWGSGDFKELLLGDVTSQLEFPFMNSVEELNIKDLFEIDEFESYVLINKKDTDLVLGKLINHPSLYVNTVYFTIEDEYYSFPMSEVPTEFIKEALLQLMDEVED